MHPRWKHWYTIVSVIYPLFYVDAVSQITYVCVCEYQDVALQENHMQNEPSKTTSKGSGFK